MIMNLESTIVIAAAEGGVVMAIILIISVISWIVNLIQGNTPQQQKAKNAPRQRPKPEELEQYLQATKSAEERQRERERKRPQQAKGERAGNDRRSNKSKQQQQPRPAAAPQQQQRPKNDRPGTRLAETHLAPTALGQGGRSLLDSQKVDAEVKLDVVSAVQRDISDAVQSDIGADGTRVVKQASAVHPLIKALRDPQGVRQAILLNEILNRPKSLR